MKYSLREYEIRRTGGRNHCFAVDEFLCCAKDEIPALRTGANLSVTSNTDNTSIFNCRSNNYTNVCSCTQG